MELGGNAPFSFSPTPTWTQPSRAPGTAKLRNNGEACTAANCFIVHADVAEEFGRRLADAFAALTVGDGLADGTDIGPFITAEARDGVHAP